MVEHSRYAGPLGRRPGVVDRVLQRCRRAARRALPEAGYRGLRGEADREARAGRRPCSRSTSRPVYYLVFRADDGRWHWSLCDERHTTVATTESGYASREACLDSFAPDLDARGGAEVVPVVELERRALMLRGGPTAMQRPEGPEGFRMQEHRPL